MEQRQSTALAAVSASSASARGSSAPTGARSIRADAEATLEAAVDAGITFFDTADVYGDGRSEQFNGALLKRHPGDLRGDQDGTPRRAADSRTTRPRTSAHGTIARAPTSASRRSIWFSCTARRTASTTATLSSRTLDQMVADRPAARLRSVGRDLRAGAQGDRASARRLGADHPQLLPAQAARAGAAGSRRGRRRDHRARAAGLGHALGPLRPQHRHSPPTTTATTTVTARPSMSARPSQASRTKSGSRLSKSSSGCSIPASRWRSSRCAG